MTAAETTVPTLAERAENRDLWPTEDGPWFPGEIHGTYDRGQDWCAAASCHANGTRGSYPHPDHGPADHCWTPQYPHLQDARAGINGDHGYLRAFMVAPFQFGEPSGPPPWEGPRLFIDFAHGDEDVKGVSMSLGDAMLLVRHIDHAISVVLRHVPATVRR